MKWENFKLKQIADYWTGKIDSSVLDETNYVSTDNLIPDKAGIVNSNYVPKSGRANSFSENDVLISNIRPYFRKIWFANKEGGCSNDVLVFRAKENVEPLYLYYQLSKDTFFDYMVAGSNGTKMPRGNKTSIMEYQLQIPPLPTQRRIASILSAYDDLIENNLKRIKLLEEKAFLRYKQIVREEKMEEFTIEELANVVMGQSPTSDTYTNEKEDNLPFHQGVTNFSNYFVEHKIYCKAAIKIAEEGDILFSVRAPVGRINFTSDKICIGRGLCAFRSKKGFQNYFYHQLKEFFFAEDVIGNGAIFNAVTKAELMKVKLKTPSEKIQREFEVEAEQMYNLILNLTNQNTLLRSARDILLPRLMNGQIEV